MRLRADPAIKQFLLPPSVGLSVNELRANPRQITFGGAQLVLLIGRVEGGEQRALLHFGADINLAAGDPPRNAETDIAFVTRLNAPGEPAEVFLIQRFDFNRQHRAHRLRRRLFFRARGQQQARRQQHQALHWSAPGARSL